MKDLLKGFIGKPLRIYTISGVESYSGILEEVKKYHVIVKNPVKEDRTYIAIQHIESFKVEEKRSLKNLLKLKYKPS